jgi:uncharacterized membrane protein HdeD (DUF308 family)
MSERHDYLTTMLQRIGGAWSWVLAFGLIGIAAGVCMLFFTGQALYGIAIAFGVWLVCSGVFRFVSAFSFTGDGWLRALTALLAAISIALGVYLLAHPVLSILVLTITVGFFWLFSGTLELMLGIELRGMPHRGWTIAGGLLSIAAGISIIFYPGISTLALALLLAFWLLTYGVTLVFAAFKLRGATHTVRAVLAPRHG